MFSRVSIMSATVAAMALAVCDSPAEAQTKVPDKVYLYKGVLSLAGAVTFDMELVWHHRIGHLKSKGEFKLAGQRFAVSEADGRIEDRNTLVIDKTWNGASGLQVETTLRFKPESGRRVRWTCNYKAYNRHLTSIPGARDPLKQQGSQSGYITITTDHAPWERLPGNHGPRPSPSPTPTPNPTPTPRPNPNPGPGSATPSGAILLSASGHLTHDDPRAGEKHYQTFTVGLKAGRSYAINLSSQTFDTFVQVKSGGAVVASNDDSGPGLNARLSFRPTHSGTYQIVVTSYRRDVTGAYRLSVR